MIPTEVEDRLARYFFHRYLPDEIMMEIENLLVLSILRMSYRLKMIW